MRKIALFAILLAFSATLFAQEPEKGDIGVVVASNFTEEEDAMRFVVREIMFPLNLVPDVYDKDLGYIVTERFFYQGWLGRRGRQDHRPGLLYQQGRRDAPGTDEIRKRDEGLADGGVLELSDRHRRKDTAQVLEILLQMNANTLQMKMHFINAGKQTIYKRG